MVQAAPPIDPSQPTAGLVAAVTAALTKDPSQAASLRNTLYLALLRDDPDRAHAVGAAMVAVVPDNLLLRRDQISLALRQGDFATARLAADHVGRIAPDDPAAMAQVIQVWLAVNEGTRAADLAEACRPAWIGQARLVHMAMLALYRAGRMAAALAAARLSLATSPDDLTMVGQAAAVLLTEGLASEALAALHRAGAETSDDVRALFETARARALLSQVDPEAVALLQRVVAVQPEHHRALDLLGRCLLAQGQAMAARDVLFAIPPHRRSAAALTQLARALVKTQGHAEALAIFGDLVAADHDNIPLRREYAGALVRAGNTEAAEEVYRHGLAQRAARLPDSFAAGIAAIVAHPPAANIPRPRLEWVHSVLQAAGRAPQDRAQWQADAATCLAIDRLFADWLECRTPRGAEVLPFLQGVDAAHSDLKQGLALGRGAFLAAAHIGVLFSGPAALFSAGVDAMWLASIPQMGGALQMNALISTSSQDESVIGRSILRALRRGAVVCISIDGSTNRQGPTVPLFDRQIALSSFLPRLAHRRQVPSYFPRLVWTGQAVKVDLIRLPDPNDGEEVEAFVARWTTEFVGLVRDMILTAPGSIRGSGGFWTGISA